MTTFTNAAIFTDGAFRKGSFSVDQDRFGGILCAESRDAIDLKGALVIPGLIDVHTHGNSGYDFSTCDLDGLIKMAEYLGRNGVTSFAATSMTMPYSDLERAYQNARQLYQMQQETPGSMSRLAGIHMEGPYFSYGKRGAQDPAFLKEPDIAGFQKLYACSGKLIRLVDLAPELPGSMEFIKEASAYCTVSVAHTEADYETALRAFQTGASHITHLFNGMNGIHHRNPGPVAAAFDTPHVYAELICDGIHIDPSVIRMVFRLFPGRVVLISDALSCCGMPDGTYRLGGQEITLHDRHAVLADHTLAGSASNLFQMLRNVISCGIPAEQAILSATLHPARQLGLDSEIGSIEKGKKADFLICSESLQLKSVFINGREIAKA